MPEAHATGRRTRFCVAESAGTKDLKRASTAILHSHRLGYKLCMLDYLSVACVLSSCVCATKDAAQCRVRDVGVGSVSPRQAIVDESSQPIHHIMVS